MAPEFALFLSPDGIALAHRQPAGHWAVLADTALDVPDLPAALEAMRQLAEDRAGPGFATLVILPDDQILYTSLTAPGPQDEDRLEQIHDGLDGLTPYRVRDLAFDYVPLEDGRVKLAVVARETLAEAEAFARDHGFEPAGFGARPLDNRYRGVAHFDRSPDWTGSIADIEFGHDSWRKSSPAAEDTGKAAPGAAGGTDAATTDASSPGALAPETPAPAVTITEDGTGASVSPGPETPAAPAAGLTTSPQGAPDLVQGSEDAPGPAPRAPLPGPAGGDSSPPAGTAATDTPEDRSDDDGAQVIAPDQPLQMPSSFGAGRDRDVAPDSAADRVGARPSRLAIGSAETGDTASDPPHEPAGKAGKTPARPRFGRGKSKPAAAASDTMPKRPAAAGPAPELPPLTRTKLGMRRKGKDAAAQPQRPALAQPDPPGSGTQAATGHANRPSARDRLSDMGKRLSAGAEKARDTASGLATRRNPDTATTTDDAAPYPGASPISARLKSLGRRMQRVGPEAAGSSDTEDDTGQTGRARVAAVEIAPPRAPKPRLPAGKRAGAGAASPILAGADNSLTGGLLGQGQHPGRRGPSLRSGLILTLILLAVLGLIAIWAVFYLPDTALARWLGLGRQQTGIEQVDTAPQISDAPQRAATPPDAADGDPAVTGLTPEAAVPQAADLLPDIDADLDLGPVPVTEPRVDPETLLPSVAETEEFYARTGIWQRPPVIDLPTPETMLGDVDLAGLDPPVTSVDAYALPVPSISPAAELPRRQSSPVDPETEFVLDDNGLVVPTPDGTLNPDGILIIAGAPVLTPPQRPGDAPASAADPTAGAIDTALLGTRRPPERPADLQEQRERALLGGITFAELGQIRPEGRPASIQELAAAEAEAAHDRADAEAEAAGIAATSEWAVAVSFVPRARPGNIDELVETARAANTADAADDTHPVATTAGAVAPASARPSDTVQPDIPSSASVTRAATRENAINLHRINLIGVTGSDSDRRALVRLPSGRFVTVGSGDRLDGGRVAAVGDRSLRYVKSGRTITLEIPAG